MPWWQVHACVSNEAARFGLNQTTYGRGAADFRSATDYWLFPYESPTFRYELEGVWDQVRPLYELLHAYVRRKLRDLYGPDKLSRKAPLPAHVLGNVTDLTAVHRHPFPDSRRQFLNMFRALSQVYSCNCRRPHPDRNDLSTGSRNSLTLSAELILICYFLALLGAHHILHISRIRVNKY